MANGGSNCKILAGRSLMCVSFKCRVLHFLAWPPSFFFDFGLFLAAAAAGLHTVVCFLSTRRPPPPAPAVVGFQFPGGKRGGEKVAREIQMSSTHLHLSFSLLFFRSSSSPFRAFISRRQQIYGLSRLINFRAAAANFGPRGNFAEGREGERGTV